MNAALLLLRLLCLIDPKFLLAAGVLQQSTPCSGIVMKYNLSATTANTPAAWLQQTSWLGHCVPKAVWRTGRAANQNSAANQKHLFNHLYYASHLETGPGGSGEAIA